MYKILSEHELKGLRKSPTRSKAIAAFVAGASLAAGVNLSAVFDGSMHHGAAVQAIVPAFFDDAAPVALTMSESIDLRRLDARQ